MSDLVIFISHKLKSRDKARKIAAALAAFGAPRVRIHYSGKYLLGVNYRQQIENDLNEASWLILLYEGPDFAWDWCLFEIGFFTAKMPSKVDPKLICLHSPEYTVPGPIQDFNSLPATTEQLKEFYGQIYIEEPWKIYPKLFWGKRGSRRYEYTTNSIRNGREVAAPASLVRRLRSTSKLISLIFYEKGTFRLKLT
jgi:hypothetical protein